MLHNLVLYNLSHNLLFNKLSIKNDPVKKAKSLFVFMERVQLPQYQVLVLKDRTFHC